MIEPFRRAVALAAALSLGLPSVVLAQGGKKESPEFTRQGLLIINFIPRAGADIKIGKRAADAVRSRVGKLVNKREVDVIDGGDIEYRMERAGYNPDSTYSISDIHATGKYFRADEYLLAYVSNGPGGPKLSGQLVLLRDERLRQPLPDAQAPRLDSAAALFAKSVAAARTQLVHERRCENALRDGSGSRALAAAKEGVATYGRSTIARTCMIWTMRQTHAPASEILAVSQEVLAVDSANYHALEAASAALDSLKRRDEAASMYFRLAATDTSDRELALRVSYALFDGQNSKRAEPFITRLAAAYPEDLRFTQQRWRIAYENKSWENALGAGEIMIARDSVARYDSTFFFRLGTAYHNANRPFKAIETLAHGVAAFPKDARMYSLYTQYIKAEADTVVPRGLALFPQSADLLAMNAKDLRAKGKIAESLDQTKKALAIDSTMAQGQLVVAQLEIELGRPDSALSSLRRALAKGEDSSLVAQFALSKGNNLYRAASTTKTQDDFSLAYRFLAFADSVHTSMSAKFLAGAAALGIAQTAVTEGVKLKEKTDACRMVRLGADMIPVARTGIAAGQESFGDMAKQSLEFLDQLEPYAADQVKTFCGAP